mgnify:CR=1 FL=1
MEVNAAGKKLIKTYMSDCDKKYDEPETVPFVNGILGSFVRGEISAE